LPEHLIPFADVPNWAIACVFVVHFIGFFIRGAFGFGSNMPIVLLTTWLLGPHHAIVLVVVTAVFAQINLLPQGFGTADWAVARPLCIGTFFGIALGTWLFTLLAAGGLTLVMGALITTTLIMDRLRLLERMTVYVDLQARSVTSSLAFLSGLVGAISGGGGLYFLVIYLKLACKTAVSLRGTNIILSGVFIMFRLGLLGVAGFVSWSVLMEGLALTPVVLFGTWLGTRLFHATSPDRFYAALQLLLIIASLLLMTRGVAEFL
jgi:uncharacterized membrane protein YfcA